MSKRLPSVFISYNSQSEFEETLAIRLHTLGAVHGYNTLLPDRTNNSSLVSVSTKQRINASDYFILFSTSAKLSAVVLEEIKVAFAKFHNKARIIIVFDAKHGKNVKGLDKCTSIFIDSSKQSAAEILEEILATIKRNEAKPVAKLAKNDDGGILAGLLLAGLGLLLLGAALSDDDR